MNNKLQTGIKAVYAGFMIGLGGIVYLSVENKIAGSVLFSFGLLTIVAQGFFLYTGKIGFRKKGRELFDMGVIALGYYLGTLIAAWMANAAHLKIDSRVLVEAKLGNSLGNVLLLSMFC